MSPYVENLNVIVTDCVTVMHKRDMMVPLDDWVSVWEIKSTMSSSQRGFSWVSGRKIGHCVGSGNQSTEEESTIAGKHKMLGVKT